MPDPAPAPGVRLRTTGPPCKDCGMWYPDQHTVDDMPDGTIALNCRRPGGTVQWFTRAAR